MYAAVGASQIVAAKELQPTKNALGDTTCGSGLHLRVSCSRAWPAGLRPPQIAAVFRTHQALAKEGFEAALIAAPGALGQAAQTNILKPHLRKQWPIPPAANAAFVAGMNDALEVYQRPHDPARPVVCVDETSKQLVVETPVPIKAKPGHIARHDHGCECNGTASVFMMSAPLEGWRHLAVTDRHPALADAHILKDLSALHFPQAGKIVPVQDNLNIHKPASLYEAFAPRNGRHRALTSGAFPHPTGLNHILLGLLLHGPWSLTIVGSQLPKGGGYGGQRKRDDGYC